MGRSKKSKPAILVITLLVAGAVVMTGTYAWWSVSQRMTNKKALEFNEGGRLHDDWDGTTKSVYVENYLDEVVDKAGPIFVRVRFQEYMEFGSEAGTNLADPNRKALPVDASSDINDVKTWPIHKVNDPNDPFHAYWKWTMGDTSGAGKTVYMPTFNKNTESLVPDVNGTYAGTNGTHFDDYVTYKLGDQLTKGAYYYAEQGDSGAQNTPISGTGGTEVGYYVVRNETHDAAETLETQKIISMKEWGDLSSSQKVGNYWVYDTDGWFYWAAPLQPETATGLLLSRVDARSNQLDDKCYYGINVVGECASSDDWGLESDPDEGNKPSGFYENGITTEALELLNTIKVIQYN